MATTTVAQLPKRLSRWAVSHWPAAVWFGCGCLVALSLGTSGGSLADPDVWWHIATGRLVLENLGIPHTDPWSFTAADDSWVTTAWGSDVLFASVWHVAGYDGIRVLRVVLALAVVTATWFVVRRHSRDDVVAAITTALVVLTLTPFLRERPQVLSFLFVLWLSVVLNGVLDGRMPSIWQCGAMSWLWANVHGMWVVVPVFLVVAGVAAWADDRRRVPLAARCTTAALVSFGAAALTPVGPRLAVWPFVVSHVAAPITEWQPATPTRGLSVGLSVILAIIVLGWAHNSGRVPTGRVLYVFAIAGFGFLAFRNVAPAALLLHAELAWALGALLPLAPLTSALRRAAPLAAVIGALLACLHVVSTPTIDPELPQRLVAGVQALPGRVTVLNDYDLGGFITGLAGDEAQVAIDGRTDVWSAAYVRDYLEALAGQRDWRPLVDDLIPDAAIVATESEIARGLVRERGWSTVMTEGRWSLLVAGVR